jgi:hypothetical protein
MPTGSPFVVAVDGGPVGRLASHPGASDAGDDRGYDLITQDEQRSDGPGLLRRDVVAARAAGFDDQVLAAQLAQIVSGLADGVAGQAGDVLDRGGVLGDSESLRDERVDHMLILGERHLREVLAEYARHYNEHWPYQSLQQEHPARWPGHAVDIITARIERRQVLGGLISEYRRAASRARSATSRPYARVLARHTRRRRELWHGTRGDGQRSFALGFGGTEPISLPVRCHIPGDHLKYWDARSRIHGPACAALGCWPGMNARGVSRPETSSGVSLGVPGLSVWAPCRHRPAPPRTGEAGDSHGVDRHQSPRG